MELAGGARRQAEGSGRVVHDAADDQRLRRFFLGCAQSWRSKWREGDRPWRPAAERVKIW
jgi:hypothetical protein